jgi:hypothetical protein
MIRCGHTDVWAGVRRESPTWYLGGAGRCSTVCPKGTAVGQGLTGGEVSTRMANKRHNAALAILGCCKDKERSGLDPKIPGLATKALLGTPCEGRGRHGGTEVKSLLACGSRMRDQDRVRALGRTGGRKDERVREGARPAVAEGTQGARRCGWGGWCR